MQNRNDDHGGVVKIGAFAGIHFKRQYTGGSKGAIYLATPPSLAWGNKSTQTV